MYKLLPEKLFTKTQVFILLCLDGILFIQDFTTWIFVSEMLLDTVIATTDYQQFKTVHQRM